MSTLQHGIAHCGCHHGHHQARLIALTGGPGAGKTAVLELALRAVCAHVAVLPESAGIVFGGGFPRDPAELGRAAAQRAIFHVQRELEALVIGGRNVAVALCDRGTLDGLAYWPGSPKRFWSQLGTTREAELSRYHAVIHLRTPAADQGYNHDNALRVESAAEAHAIDERILAAWDGHPRRTLVSSAADFLSKASEALALIRAELPRCCRAAHPEPEAPPAAG